MALLIVLSLHPLANIWSAVLKLHTIRFTARQKPHCVATDLTDVFQVQNDFAAGRLKSKSLLNSAIACVSTRPLRTNTFNPPRAAVSILKVIDQATRSRVCGACSSYIRPRIRKCIRRPKWNSLKTKLEMGNWSDRILGSPRIPGVQRWDYRIPGCCAECVVLRC